MATEMDLICFFAWLRHCVTAWKAMGPLLQCCYCDDKRGSKVMRPNVMFLPTRKLMSCHVNDDESKVRASIDWNTGTRRLVP